MGLQTARSLVASLALVSSVLACTSYGVERAPAPDSAGALRASGGFYVALAEDGAYDETRHRGSGRMITRTVVSVLKKRGLRVESAGAHASRQANLDTARQREFGYLVVPTALHWEERATEWSGIPDRISVQLELIEVESGRVAESAVVTGRSTLATFGGDHPQDLLPGAIAQYFEQVF